MIFLLANNNNLFVKQINEKVTKWNELSFNVLQKKLLLVDITGNICTGTFRLSNFKQNNSLTIGNLCKREIKLTVYWILASDLVFI